MPIEDWTHLRAAATAQLRGFSRIPHAVREELVQEALVRTWLHPGVLKPRAFVARTVQNLALSWLRRPRERASTGLERGSTAWADQIEARLDLGRAIELIEEAPPTFRQMLGHVLHEEPIASLVEAELGAPEDEVERAAWVRRRDALYKRRRRSLAWLGAQLKGIA